MRREYVCNQNGSVIIVEDGIEYQQECARLASLLEASTSDKIRKALDIIANKNQNKLINIAQAIHGRMYIAIRNSYIGKVHRHEQA